MTYVFNVIICNCCFKNGIVDIPSLWGFLPTAFIDAETVILMSKSRGPMTVDSNASQDVGRRLLSLRSFRHPTGDGMTFESALATFETTSLVYFWCKPGDESDIDALGAEGFRLTPVSSPLSSLSESRRVRQTFSPGQLGSCTCPQAARNRGLPRVVSIVPRIGTSGTRTVEH